MIEAVSRPSRVGAQSLGGCYAPETLMQPLLDLEEAFRAALADPIFQAELKGELRHFVGRPTPLSPAPRLAAKLGLKALFLKREDLTHTGAHKINNALAQAILARRMGKTEIIAETGAGQHGVAAAAACARLGLACTVYMGVTDMALYKHVSSKDELLSLMLDALVSRLPATPTGDLEDSLRASAFSSREFQRWASAASWPACSRQWLSSTAS